MRTMIAAAAALCMVTAPIAAQAGTRANEVVPAAVTIERNAQPVTGASAMSGETAIPTVILIGIIAATVWFALEVFDDDEFDGVSDG